LLADEYMFADLRPRTPPQLSNSLSEVTLN
jgi:hypothetical protein